MAKPPRSGAHQTLKTLRRDEAHHRDPPWPFSSGQEAPGSITDIAARLQRDRSAVKRDLDELEQVGLVTIAEKVLPGHGRMKEAAPLRPGFNWG